MSTIRKCGYIPVKVGTITQTGHTVAYVLVTKVDGFVHKFVMYAVVTSMEAVVNRRIQRGDTYF